MKDIEKPSADIRETTLKNFEVVPTSNLLLVKKWLNYTREKKALSLITGSNGYGKTTALKFFRDGNPDIKYFSVDVGEPAKIFYARFLHELAEDEALSLEKLKKSYIHYLMQRASYIINSRSDISLIMVDEFGNFNRRYVAYLRQIWDNIHATTGLTLVGPPSVLIDLELWQSQQYKGINELISRIGTNKIHFKETTYKDVKMICNSRGIDDLDEIRKFYRTSKDLRVIGDMIEKHFEGIDIWKNV